MICLFLLEFADDFNPSKSLISTKGSCWAKTITISPSSSIQSPYRNTYPIAVGPKKACHSHIEQRFLDELNEFRSGSLKFRVGKSNRLVTVYLDLVVSINDQPERRKKNCILLGNSDLTARWRHICDVSFIKDKLPYCEECWGKVARNETTTNNCIHCFQWITEDRLFPSPSNYPSDLPSIQRDSRSYLSSHMLSYDQLIQSVRTCQRRLLQKQWNIGQCRAYLKSNGINQEGVSMLLHHVKDLRRRFTGDHPNQIDDEHLWNGPVSWHRNLDLSSNIDVPMHLLFLGITKAMIALLQDFLSTTNLRTRFNEETNHRLNMISKLYIEWCKPNPTMDDGSTGGWKSEHYVAFARVMHWIYHDCIRNHCHILQRMELFQVISSLFALLSRVMARQVNDVVVGDIDRHVKIFLQIVDRFCNKTYPSTEAKEWFTKYNYICLLNLSSIAAEFGPIRNYWEGGLIGEKTLQLAKRSWYGFTKNCYKNLLSTMMKKLSMKKAFPTNSSLHVYEALLKDDDSNNDDNEDATSGEDECDDNLVAAGKMCKRYTHAEITRSMDNGFCFSTVVLDDNNAYVVMKKRKLIRLDITAFEYDPLTNLHCFDVALVGNPIDILAIHVKHY